MTPERGRTAKGPVIYDLHSVEPADFETLTYLLASAEFSNVVIVRNKDRGLDARQPDPMGLTTLRGWQSKRFAQSEIHFAQCQKSLDDAIAFWRPLRVTFVFASDLSAREQKLFASELVERHPEVRVDFWSGTEVQRRLRDTDEGRRAVAWLFEDQQSLEDLMAAMVSKEPVRTPAEIAERQARLQERLDRDPHFYYTTVSRPVGAPETPPAAGTLASFVMEFGGQEVRYDLAERYPGAAADLGGPPEIVLSDDPAGREAARILNATRQAAGPITIGSGVGVRWPTVPVGLRGLMPDPVAWGTAELQLADDETTPDPSVPPTFPVVAHGGDAALGMALARADAPQPGFEATSVAAAGGLELLYSVTGDVERQIVTERRLDWRHTLGVGPALDQLLSARIARAVLGGAPFRLHVPSQEEPVVVAEAPPTVGGGAQDIEALDSHISFLELVCEVQRWLGRPLMPPPRPTDADLTQLGRAIALVRQPRRSGTWTELIVTATVEPPERCIAAVLTPVYVTLFGAQVYLGIEMTSVRAKVASRMGDDVRFVPDDHEAVAVAVLASPEEAPPEAAQAAGALDGARVLVRSLAD